MKVPAWLKVDPAELVLEIISIVLAILVALGVNHWQEERRMQAEVATSLTAIRSEISLNRAMLEARQPFHRQIRQGIASFLDADSGKVSVGRFLALIHRLAPHGMRPVFAETFAWDIARASPAASHIPYETRLLLEQTYAEQALLTRFGWSVIDDFHFTSTTSDPDMLLVTITLGRDWGDVIASEERLDSLYAAALENLPAGEKVR